MDVDRVKTVYLDHYKTKGYQVLPSSPLVHPSIPTAFVMSVGLLQLEPILASRSGMSEWQDFAMVQRCIRHYDMEMVGRGNRLSFFEMAGAINSGDRGQRQVVGELVELLLKKYGFPRERLVFTVFAGGRFNGKELKPDNRSYEALCSEGISADRIKRYGPERNLFGTAQREQYCGPSLETFFEREADPSVSAHFCEPGCQRCNRYLEIGNTVFLRYRKANGRLVPLQRTYGESALGVERTALAISGQNTIYDLPELAAIRDSLRNVFVNPTDIDVAADHLRAICFAIADGARPGHGGRRYVLRKLIRRFLVRVGEPHGAFDSCVRNSVQALATANYHVLPLTDEHFGRIISAIREEKEVFNK